MSTDKFILGTEIPESLVRQILETFEEKGWDTMYYGPNEWVAEKKSDNPDYIESFDPEYDDPAADPLLNWFGVWYGSECLCVYSMSDTGGSLIPVTREFLEQLLNNSKDFVEKIHEFCNDFSDFREGEIGEDELNEVLES